MPDKKLIAVVGGTGSEGGGLARAILDDSDGEFACRVLTRKPESPTARGLAELGAEILYADLDDEESLTRGFEGAYAAYCMTHFWERFSAEAEIHWAESLARAVRCAGVQHVVRSTAPDSRRWFPLDDDRMPTLQGRFKVPPFDGKAEGDRYFAAAGVPTTYFMTCSLFELLCGRGAPRRGADRVLSLMLPLGDAEVSCIAAEDVGRAAYGIFKAGGRYVGQTIAIAAEHLSYHDVAARLSVAIGEEVRYTPIPPDVFRSLPFPGADVGGNLFQFVAEAGPDLVAMHDPVLTRQLNPSLQTFDAWLAANKERIPRG